MERRPVEYCERGRRPDSNGGEILKKEESEEREDGIGRSKKRESRKV